MGTDHGAGGNHVRAINGATLATNWDTIVDTSTLADRRIYGVVYVAETDEVWAWNRDSLFILNPSNGSKIATKKPSDFSVAKFRAPSTVPSADEFVYVNAERTSSPIHGVLKIDPDTRALDASYFSSNAGLTVRYTTTNHVYWSYSSYVHAHHKSDLTADAKSDHGNLGGTGFTSGTALSGLANMVADTSTMIYAFSTDSGGRAYRIEDAIWTHTQDGHDYLPSNTTPGAALDMDADVIYGSAYSAADHRLYVLAKEVSTSNKKLHTVVPGSSPTVESSTLVESNSVSGWVVPLRQSGGVAVIFTNTNIYTY